MLRHRCVKIPSIAETQWFACPFQPFHRVSESKIAISSIRVPSNHENGREWDKSREVAPPLLEGWPRPLLRKRLLARVGATHRLHLTGLLTCVGEIDLVKSAMLAQLNAAVNTDACNGRDPASVDHYEKTVDICVVRGIKQGLTNFRHSVLTFSELHRFLVLRAFAQLPKDHAFRMNFRSESSCRHFDHTFRRHLRRLVICRFLPRS